MKLRTAVSPVPQRRSSNRYKLEKKSWAQPIRPSASGQVPASPARAKRPGAFWPLLERTKGSPNEDTPQPPRIGYPCPWRVWVGVEGVSCVCMRDVYRVGERAHGLAQSTGS